MKKKSKIIIATVLGFVLALSLALLIPFSVLGVRSNQIKTDYSSLKNDSHYSQKAEVEGIELVSQHISCGYATIEMLSSYYGKTVSEDDLDEKNSGTVSTSSTNGFLNEVNQSIPSQSFQKKTYLENAAFLKEIHDSLSKQHPVAIEWAAQYEGEWTLHFSLVSSLDIGNDEVVVYNPYGYIEKLSIEPFLERTTFQAYEKMPLFLKLGFAYGAFDKNACFHAE